MPEIRVEGLTKSFADVRALDRVSFSVHEGEFFTLTDAKCEPKPVQARLPIWVGGGGEKGTLRIGAMTRQSALERIVACLTLSELEPPSIVVDDDRDVIGILE